MKRKFSKILGVGLTLALLFSLLLVAAPVSALTQPSVTVDIATISVETEYSIVFSLGKEVPELGKIVIEFPEGTDITGVEADDVTFAATSGIGSTSFSDKEADTIVIDEEELTITVPDVNDEDKIGVGAMVQVVVSGVVNPDDPDDYTLDVSTLDADDDEIEDAETSAAYEIEVPDIGVLPGIVQQYNAADILMDQDTGNDAINEMVASAGEDYTIVVGPGEYKIDDTIDLDQDGLTLESSAGAEDTIIVAHADLDDDAIVITADEVTVDGFTIEDTADGDTAIKVRGDDAIVQNNIFTAEDGYPEGISIEGSAAGATVSDNELDIYHTMMVQVAASDCTLSDNTFGAGINLHNAPSDITITGNDIIGSELWGIVLWTGGTYTDIVIEGNTISETTEGDAIGICIQGTAEIDDLQIAGNDITDNEGVGILIESDVTIVTGSAIAINFNTISGNEDDGYGIQNDSDADVDASFNWWGTSVADDVGDMVNDSDDGETTYEPFLTDTLDAVLSAGEVALGATSLDASSTVGVRVSGATDATVIAVARYILNPQEAISDAIAFFDVYVVTATADVDVTIKFFAGDENSTLEVWSADTEAWVELDDADYSVYGGYMHVDVLADLLDGTPFVVIAGEAEEDELLPTTLDAPVSGDDTVSLTPTFAWAAVADADGYYFELADNANFVLPLVKLDGDTGRLIVTAYAYVGELPYSSPYYWRVKAVSGTIAAGDLVEGDWASAVFITMDEPVEPTPPVEIVEAPELPDITIEQPDITIESPDIIVPLPDVIETPITPSWIYVIIAVGAVLVIALLVLIVRTRRVA